MTAGSISRRAGLTLLLVVALAAGAGIVALCRSATDAEPADGPVTAEEIDKARVTLAAAPGFKVLAQGTEWTVSQATRDTAPGSRAGIGLILQLPEPVDSDGPWKQLRCQGTVSEAFSFQYKGIETVGVVLDRSNSKVIALQPLPSAHLSFRDEDVAKQPTLTPCPRGYEDPEN